MRFLLDTKLLVRAAITRGGLARKLLRYIEQSEEHVLIVSSHILSEVADVLHRPSNPGTLASFTAGTYRTSRESSGATARGQQNVL